MELLTAKEMYIHMKETFISSSKNVGIWIEGGSMGGIRHDILNIYRSGRQ